MKNKNYKAIIFDLDGTIADTGGDLSNAINLMLGSFGFAKKSREEILKHINFGARAFVKGCLPDDLITLFDDSFLDEALSRYKKFYAEHYLEETKLYDGIADLVRFLHENGVKMCVLSNKHEDMTKRIVGELFDKNYFVEVVGGSITEHGSVRFPHKPEPDSALYLAERMEVESYEILYIGDSDVDMKTAINAGMFPLGVTWGYRAESVLVEAGARKIARSPREILEFIVV